MPDNPIAGRVVSWLACLLLAPCAAQADAPAPGIHFTHHDWEMACDNTRTCRAAGYHADDGDSAPISILLTRKAGAGTPVTGQLMLGQYDDPTNIDAISLYIDDTDLGPVALEKDSGLGDLSQAQVRALLAVLPPSGVITARAPEGHTTWTLSDTGATAVLIKMDEFQGRIGTRGALIRPGEHSETNVPPAAPIPVLRIAPQTPARDTDASLVTDPALRETLLASLTGEESCDETLAQDNDAQPAISRLGEHTLLASILCWRGAYNESHAYWLIADTPPYNPRLITNSASDYADGEITASQKGRGLGDCWWSASWVWTGETFVHAADGTTGMCRLLAPGGAWTLPTLMSDVQR